MAIVTAGDVIVRLGRLPADDTENARINAFITDATALVLDYCQTDFQQHTGETFTLMIEGGEVDIPPRYLPNLVVSSVQINDAVVDATNPDTTDPLVLTTADWKVIGRTLYLRRSPVLGTVTLTASWGWPAVPPVVQMVICQEVIRWLSVSPGTVLEKTGELEVQYAPQANGGGLSNAAKDSLKKYRKRMTSLTFERTHTVAPGREAIQWLSSTTTLL